VSTAPSAAPASSAAASAATGGIAVAIKNFSFNPATVAAKVNQKITWTNGDDTAHTVTFDDSSVTSSGNVNPTFSFDATIAKAGTYTYHCKIHPTMQGTVTVS
jgi:plastocyanin